MPILRVRQTLALMGILYDRAHGVRAAPAQPARETIPLRPPQRPGYCAMHGRQLARLKGVMICWPCYVEQYGKMIVRPREARDAQEEHPDTPRTMGHMLRQ